MINKGVFSIFSSLFVFIKDYKFRSIFIKIFLAVTIVSVTLSLGLSFFIYNMYSKALLDKTHQLSNTSVKKSIESLEKEINSLYAGLLQNSSNIETYNFFYSNYTSNEDRKYNEIKLGQTYNRFRVAHPIVKRMMFLNVEDEVCLSSLGFQGADYYFSRNYPKDEMIAKDWRMFLTDGKPISIFKTMLIEDINTGNLIRESIVLKISYPAYSKNPQGYFIINLDSTKVDAELDAIARNNQGVAFLINSEDELLHSYERYQIQQYNEIDIKKIINTASTSVVLGEKEYLFNMNKIKLLNVKVLFLSPYEKVLEDITESEKVVVIVLSIAVIFSILISLIISYLIYRPLFNIMKNVKRFFGDDRKKPTNEADYINSVVFRFYEQNSRLEGLVESFRPEVKQSLLLQILNGDQEITEDNILKIKNYGLDFQYECFCIIQIRIFSEFHVTMAFKPLDRNECTLESVHDGNRIYVIVNFSGYIRIEDLMDEISANILSEAGINGYSITAGNVSHSIKDLVTSNNEATFAFNYSKPSEGNTLYALYDDSYLQHDSTHIFYPVDIERKIISLVISGDYNACIEEYRKLIERNKSEGITILGFIRLVNEISATLRKVIDEIKGFPKNHFDDGVFNFEEADCYNFSTAENKYSYICMRVASYVDSQKASHNFKLKDRIQEYMDSNLSKDLQLSDLADTFSMNAQYISRFFKEHFGTNFVDYLNSARINKAKLILASDNKLKISDIAAKVGYNSSNHFIRIFSKYEGVTPNEFRNRFKAGRETV